MQGFQPGAHLVPKYADGGLVQRALGLFGGRKKQIDETAARDREDFLGKLKMANANEVVDLFGNAVTTLMNQVSARGTYSGTERDVTDWDSILA